MERFVVSVHTESWQCVKGATLVKRFKKKKHSKFSWGKSKRWTSVTDSRPFGETWDVFRVKTFVRLKTRKRKDQHPTRRDKFALPFESQMEEMAQARSLPARGEWFRTTSHSRYLSFSWLGLKKKCLIPNHCEIESEQSEGKYLICSYFHSDPHQTNNCLFICSLSLTKRLLENLLGVSNDDDQRSFHLLALDTVRGLGQVSLLRLDHLNLLCLQHIFRPVDLGGLSLVLGFGQNKGPRFDGKLRLAAYPEGAFGDADSAPGDGQGVFERGGRRVGAGVDAVALALHLYLHRKPLRILARGKNIWAQWGKAGECTVRPHFCIVPEPGFSEVPSQHPLRWLWTRQAGWPGSHFSPGPDRRPPPANTSPGLSVCRGHDPTSSGPFAIWSSSLERFFFFLNHVQFLEEIQLEWKCLTWSTETVERLQLSFHFR